ncbi:MAG: helix-turn-helix transcriptional regulator [Gemmatimonadaceae bacterium]|nr:helix-turn-helix transcriptional regulator [Gemmatimonadaceae bacterium]
MRSRLDAATLGSFLTIHTDSLHDALAAVRNPSARALLLSPRMLNGFNLPDIGKLVLSGTGVLPVAILGGQGPTVGQELLDLGACGVRRLVDLSDRDGWNKLREMVSDAARATTMEILGSVLSALGDPTPGSRQFFDTLVRVAPKVTTLKVLASVALQAHASTLMSRFFRASLPSPKRYLAEIRLVYAAALLDSPGASIADVAYRLDYSSPQSFGRHIRAIAGVPASEFRRSSFSTVLNQYTTSLIVPYQATFRSFNPLGLTELSRARP